MATLYVGLGIAILILALIYASKNWGQSGAEKKQAETALEKKEADEKITSKPYVSGPFGRMRKKD